MSETRIGARVRVIPPGGIRKLFASKARRTHAGEIGTVLQVEQKTYSNEQVYYISFGHDASDVSVFLDRELEKL